MRTRKMLKNPTLPMISRPALLLLATSFLTASATHAREAASLFEPGETPGIDRIESSDGGEVTTTAEGVVLRGPGGEKATTFTIHPSDGAWDLSAWNHLRVDFTNEGTRLARIVARLNNRGGQGYMPGTAIVPAKREGTLGFSFIRPGNAYDGPGIFRSQYARPSGHRTHWRSFDPADIRVLRLTIHAAGPFALRIARPAACWAYGSEANADLEALPYLDRFGQLRTLEWPGKISSDEEIRTALADEARAAKANPMPGFNRFGGWKDGPQQEATGYFHTGKVDGRWWLIDPDGALFWSHGANSVGTGTITPATRARRPLFEWLPEERDPLHDAIMVPARRNRPPAANFLRGNLARALGPDYEVKTRALNHDRLRSWGMNTLGGWSDSKMFSEQRTPYTHMLHVWHANLDPGGNHYFPDPYDPNYEAAVRRTIGNIAHTSEDPWCLGVFIDNEINWTNNLAPWLFRVQPSRPIKSAFIENLEAHHGDIEYLNRAWGTSFENWHEIKALRTPPDISSGHTSAFDDDVNRFYAELAELYYSTCKRVMSELMPNHLYLGSRIHRAPRFVIEAAARHVDVFSSNEYTPTGASNKLPRDIDLPVIIGEFHFGAPDRGVPGTGLFGVNDQTQRALAYAAYVSAALIDPRCVGTHWFAFPDQSAAGRPGENFQIGMVDITGRAYPGFTTAVRRVANHIYNVRANPPASIESAVETIVEN